MINERIAKLSDDIISLSTQAEEIRQTLNALIRDSVGVSLTVPDSMKREWVHDLV